MGSIRSQASTQIIINYLATAFSLLAVILVYPLDLQAYALAQFLMMTAFFLVPFVTLGSVTLAVKFCPGVQTGRGKDSFLLNVLLLATSGMILFSLWPAHFQRQCMPGLTSK